MIEVKSFVFNDFQVNTFVIFDETRECIIVDPGNSNEKENGKLDEFIAANGLKVVGMLTTHLHIDHMFGCYHVKAKYNVPFLIHEEGIHFLNTAIGFASVFGYKLEKVPVHDGFMKEGEVIKFGNSELLVLETPGHAAGSFCFVCKEHKFVFVGDVLFSGSIGRTDLPSGSMEELMQSIRKKLFKLPDDYKVYCGHGPETTIGEEKLYNPYLN